MTTLSSWIIDQWRKCLGVRVCFFPHLPLVTFQTQESIVSAQLAGLTVSCYYFICWITLSKVSHPSSPFTSHCFFSAGSKEEAFFDSKAWLDSDCEDDFYSVNGGKHFLQLSLLLYFFSSSGRAFKFVYLTILL